MLIQWNGSKWTGNDIPDSAMPHRVRQPGRLSCSRKGWTPVCHQQNGGRSVPGTLRAVETPLGTNPLHPNVVSNPVVVCMNKTRCGWVKKSSSRMWVDLSSDRALPHLDQARIAQRIAQPEQFVEISETLAAAKGIIMAIVSLSPASVDLSARWLCNAPSEAAECKRSAG